MTENEIIKIERAGRESKKLSENLNSLDFELTQFNQFTHKLKTLKIKGIIFGVIFGLLGGALLTVVAIKPVVQLYVDEKSKNVLQNKGFVFFENDKIIQIYTNRNSEIFEHGENKVLQINK